MSKVPKILVLFLALIFILIEHSKCDEIEFKTVNVKLRQGEVSGKVEESFLKQQEYYAFRGIPYAEPPLGTLRFQPPKPLVTWDGTYKAYENKPTCLQFCSRERSGEPFGLSGSEDCLYLSVFTPALQGSYPVIVFDYNDNFKTGFNGSDTYSPDFFIEEEVIVVMIAHRLGSLGYLTTEDEIIPGNNGLRDYILGLKWVKDNIINFGGDNTRITLQGNKGGAALANILLYSEQAKGLFSAVAMQSGTALETTYFYKNPRSKAFEFGALLKIKTDDSKTLLEELQKVDAEKLIRNEFMIHDDKGLIINHMSSNIFAPTVEIEHKASIITTLPENGKIVNDVPVLIGMTSREGLDLAQHFIFDPILYEKALSGITMYLPVRVDFRFDRDSLVYNRDAAKEINEVYYKDGYLHVGNVLEYAEYIGDVLHGYAIDKSAKTLSKELDSSVFYYLFDFRGLISENSEYLARYSRFGIQHWGATITDDLCYLYLCTRRKKTYEELNKLVTEQVEYKILKKMVRLWTNFAKTRNPISDEEDNITKGIKWEPISKDNQEAKYLHISKKFLMKKEPLGRRAKFWDEFLNKYSEMAVDGIVTDKDGKGYQDVPFENMRYETKGPTQDQKDDIQLKKDETQNMDNTVTPVINIEYGKDDNDGNIDIEDDAKVIVANNDDGHVPVTLPYEEIRNEL